MFQKIMHTFNKNYNTYFYKYNRQLKYNQINTYSVFQSFINIITKSGNTLVLNKIINLYYKFILINYKNKFNIINFYQVFIDTICDYLIPINSFILKKINKKKKKNARLKSKYERSISYLVPNKRLNFVYKWLNIELITLDYNKLKYRIYVLFSKLMFGNIKDLLIWNLKKKLHKILLINFLKKKKY